jgi:AcrR family transcriptional regulator
MGGGYEMSDSPGRGSSGSKQTGVRRPKSGRTRRTLRPEEITRAALRIADAEGLDAVSIRRLAAELDARPMSLYDHFASKNDLLDSMMEEVALEVLVPGLLPQDWRPAAQAIARRSYATFVRHPWMATLFGRRPRFGPNSQKCALQAAAATSSLPLAEDVRWTVFGILNDYVLGHSIRAVAGPSDLKDLDDLIPDADLAAAPELASLPASIRSRGSAERFEIGLESVLDGLERRFLGNT